MKLKLPLGLKSYEKLKRENYYAVDKTLMIKDFLERGNEVTLITRPRRFGKTINMSMMAEFFDITKDSKDIFEGTNIMKTEYASQINQYPVIFLTFANAKGVLFNVIQQIKLQLQNLYDKYSFIFFHLTEFESSNYQMIKENLLHVADNNFNNINNTLSFLMEQMERYYGKKVMVFIDEYDTPFIEAHINGFYDDIRSPLSSLLHNALKTSANLQYAMLTGIQRVAKENIFSDLNNLTVCTVKDEEYSQYFGFSEDETKNLLEYYGLSLNEEVKQMYDGYRFADLEIYNPWSIINYASRKKLEPYWVNTSSNKMIRKAMAMRDRAFDRDYEGLIRFGTVKTFVRMETSFYEANTDASLWGLFINAGYLTIDEIISEKDGIYSLKIPNEEVQKEFQNLTAHYLKVSETTLTEMFVALKYGMKEYFIDRYKKMLLEFPSYHDLKDENSYHVLFLGMCAWLSNDYEIISNKEEGKGRCDIILKAKEANKTSYVLEFKYLKGAGKEQLKRAALEAIEQIKEKQYDVNLKEKVVYIGLAHHAKEAELIWINK